MENKKAYTEIIEKLLLEDERSEVKSCCYRSNSYIEVVEIVFRGGNMVSRINVSANSLGAILQEVCREVYGSGATGTFYRGFQEEKEDE